MSLSQSSAPLPRFRAVSDSASTAALRRDLTPRTPRVSFMQVATYIWLFLSLSVAVLGYAACMSSATHSFLHCTPTACTFERYQGKFKSPVEQISFSRDRLVGAETTRTRNGEVVSFEGARRRRQRVLGHSYLIKYLRKRDEEVRQDLGSTESSILFTKHNTGRKRARRQTLEINKYARGELNWLEVMETKRWNAFGVLSLVVGLVSAAFAMLVGDLFGNQGDENKLK
ncbi:hypothetical protein Naga_100011g58 [Nannochloropsis gaditana]|uniref:Transmembrane protein n=1 Tax=Nannochloropsis gaditana TaxID=72520 RepID=W7TP31_9STRA|nr:hypothetical protein Naga_100011g58 [Nannochloropsis gaditana]